MGNRRGNIYVRLIMAIALVGFGSAVFESAAQTMELPLHASAADGHLILAFAGADTNQALSCPETGVTEETERQVVSNPRVGAVYSKIASSEPANWTIDLAGGVNQAMRGVTVALSGVDSGTPMDASVTDNDADDSDTHATPAIVTATNDAWVFSFIFGKQTSTSSGSRTAPSGYTEDIDTGGLSFILVAHKTVATAGTETPGTWGNAGAGADHTGFTVAVRPSSSVSVASKAIHHLMRTLG